MNRIFYRNTKLEICQILLDLEKAKNEFQWVNFLVDIDYMVKNKIELIGEPD